jgi:hypothetical protein
MKKSLRILTVLSIAASSILFATPSQAVSVGGVDVTVGGGTTIASSTSNRVILSGTSTSASDYVDIDLGGGISIRIANMLENNLTYNPRPTIGIPSTPESGYSKTINVGLGQGYNAKADVYINGSLTYQALCPSGNFTAPTTCSMQKTNRAFTPFVQFNYTAATGIISAQIPVTSGNGATITIASDGTYSLSGGQTITAWVVAGTSVVVPTTSVAGAPSSVAATATWKRSATVSFAAPASNGGSAITSYTATSTPGGLTQTLTQATGGTFNFDGLQPGTAYTFAVTATNAIGTSAAATSNSVTTTPLVVASLSSLSFADDGTGTGGKIVWSGKSIDAVLYTGPVASYPGPYNYGAFTGGWNGRIRNLTPGTEYTVSLFVVSADGVGESKSLTFKTSATLPVLAGAASTTVSQAAQMATQLPKLFAWINENVFVDGEGDRMKTVLNKFDAMAVPAHSAFLKLPNSSVVRVSATSSTPAVCKVEGQVTVHSIAAGTCTISYTVSGSSKAPATMVKDFVFAKFAK